ncbi:nitrite/sulfite reductase [Lachnospiraceae bacterium 42-17]|jgi:sulfite reductase (ferredoxin)|nr:nitrite/sulfite reductase [Dorea sp.]
MKPSDWKKDYEEFERITRQFHEGEISIPQYKALSGAFGSYAQRGAKTHMLRLRFPGGRVNKAGLKFIADSIRKYQIDKVHFTTCQTVQLHNLSVDTVCELAVSALDYGIVTRGGGGDFPRNVMVSPLSGVEQGEYFDVMPYAEAASSYLMGLIKTVRLPRKLKVCFSNSPKNVTHATFRDLGFAARRDGGFDVYSAGGLGNNPKMGVLVAEGAEANQILYYIKAMVKMFVTYGNYENRAKARTRYMQDLLGESYSDCFIEKLQEALREEDLVLPDYIHYVTKEGDGSTAEHIRAIPQKQKGLYAVAWHPAGGCPKPEEFGELYEAVKDMEETELRIAPDETVYIINCTGKEAKKILDITSQGAENLFETSVACIGASICQIGVRDSQKLLKELISASREWKLPDGVLPQIHISGCPSSCGTHQIGRIGFRGGMKRTDGKPQPAFILTVNGNDEEGKERFGEQVGTILETDIPAFLKELGEEIAKSGLTFEGWYKEHKERFREIAKPYVD